MCGSHSRETFGASGRYSIPVKPLSMRTVSALMSLAFVASTFAQDSPQISFETKATTLNKVLKGLSAQAGEELECSPEFRNLAMIVSVKDVALEPLLTKIAKTALGTWTKTPKGRKLVSDKDAWRALEAKAFADRVEGLSEALKSYLDSRKADVTWDAQRAAELVQAERKSVESMLANIRKNNPNFDSSNVTIHKGSSRASTPATPALLEVLAHLPVQILAQVEPGQRLVFSSSPTRMQRPLPFNASQAISRFVDAHNVLASAVTAGPPQPGNVRVNGGLDLTAKPIGNVPIKMLVVLNRGNEDDGLGIEVKFADQTGVYIGRASGYLRAKTKSSDPAQVSLTKDERIDFSPVASELANALVGQQGQSNGSSNRIVMRGNDSMFAIGSDSPTPAPPLTSAALGILVDPVDTDPQSTFVSEGLLAAAHANSVNLVAALPDSVILPMARETIKDSKTSAFVNALSSLKVNAVVEDGFLVLTPADRLKMGLDQMDREAAGRLFGPVLKRGYARLFELAQFSTSLGPTPRTANFGFVALRLLDPFVAENLQMGMLEQPFLYRFLGTLDASFFEGARPELAFQLGTLTPLQRTLLEKVAFASDGMGTVIGEGDFVGISISDGPDDPAPSAPSLKDEPTEVMPNGLPGVGRVTLKFKPEQMAKGIVTGQRGGQFFTPGSLGGHFAFQEKQASPNFDFKIVAFDGFIESQGFIVTVTTEFTQGRVRDYTYADAWLKPGAVRVNFDALSPEFRAGVEKAKQEMSRSNFHIAGDGPPPQK